MNTEQPPKELVSGIEEVPLYPGHQSLPQELSVALNLDYKDRQQEFYVNPGLARQSVQTFAFHGSIVVW